MENEQQKYEEVKEYYGETLKKTEDLKTDACCPKGKKLNPSAAKALKEVHEEVTSRYYGCGNPIPENLEGAVLLDLGSGTGRDVYVAAQLIGPEGKAIGVDMTDEQLKTAREYQDYHAEKFGFKNTEFIQGFIEDFVDLGKVEEGTCDVCISNCVVNLSPNKDKVFRQVWKALKEGGEFYFSDIYTDRRVPKELQNDKVLWGECLTGALYLEDFRRLMAEIGFKNLRIVSQRHVSLNKQETIREKLGEINFYSITVRAFKMTTLEDRAEDYQQTATYLGGIPDYDEEYEFDENYTFKKGEPVPVCRNTAMILSNSESHTGSRYAKFFEVSEPKLHAGSFSKQSFNLEFTKKKGKCCTSKTEKAGCCASKKEDAKACCAPKTEEAKSCCAPKESESKSCCWSEQAETEPCCSSKDDEAKPCCSSSECETKKCCDPESKKCC